MEGLVCYPIQPPRQGNSFETDVKWQVDIFSFSWIRKLCGYRDSECTKWGKKDCQLFELGFFNGVDEDALVKFLRVLFAHPPPQAPWHVWA